MDELMDQIEAEELEGFGLSSRIGNCCMCDYEILSYENHYVVGEDLICEDCIVDYADEYLMVWGEEY